MSSCISAAAQLNARRVCACIQQTCGCETEEDPVLRKLIRREEGQDLIEYAVLAAFISVIAIVTVKSIGPLVDALYLAVSTALS